MLLAEMVQLFIYKVSLTTSHDKTQAMIWATRHDNYLSNDMSYKPW